MPVTMDCFMMMRFDGLFLVYADGGLSTVRWHDGTNIPLFMQWHGMGKVSKC